MRTTVTTLLTLLISPLITPAATLTYTAFDNNKPQHSVIFTITKTHDTTKINTHVTGDHLEETNTCILSSKNNLISINQETRNDPDKAYFSWKISHQQNNYSDETYTEIKQRTSKTSTVRIAAKSYPIQALLYLFQEMPLSENYTYTFTLLKPYQETYPISCKVVEKTTLTLGTTSIPCYKIEATIDNFLSLFIPKSYFWLSVAKPHIPIQYRDYRFEYRLQAPIS
ncbi:MAG: hypothetical protein EXS67_05120 [Candidatus Margulisbacteria bacterium]|nr:hypothetical protein [Candidatus Margulisiibacteriota bacterium]